MFTILVLLPSLSFFVLSYYAGQILKHVGADVRRLVLCKPTQDTRILCASLVHTLRCTDVTPELNRVFNLSCRRHPWCWHHNLDVTHLATPAPSYLRIDYLLGGERYSYYYKRAQKVVFPPERLGYNTTTSNTRAHLFFHHVLDNNLAYKSIRRDVTNELRPILGPEQDWFGGSQKHPLIVYYHLRQLIDDLVRHEVLDTRGYIKVNVKVYVGDSTCDVVRLTKLLPYKALFGSEY